MALRVINDSDFDTLKSKYGEGRVLIIESSYVGDIAFRCPTKIEYQRFRESVGPNESGARRGAALETLVRQCVVVPPTPEFDEELKLYPGLVETCVNAILEMAAVEEKPRIRK